MNKKLIFIALAAILGISGAHAGGHVMGYNQECFYDSTFGGNNYRYYYCGTHVRKCANKGGGGKKDKYYTLYHGQSFTFEKDPRDTYYCCGGSATQEGKFIKGTSFYVSSETVRKQLSNGSCNRQIKVTICGDTEEIDCDTPENCTAGYVLRNSECVKPCGEDEVYESSTSNTCIKCETTRYQGIDRSVTEPRCIKCDKDTEFFDKTNKTCVAKATLVQYSRPEMKECWRCPNDYVKACQEAIKVVDKMGKTGQERIKEINSLGSFSDIADLAKQCHLDE